MKENKLICIAGMAGAGKSTVADFFAKEGYQFIRFGQITLDIIKEKGLKVNEKSEKKVREEVRKQYGMEAYATLNVPKFRKLLKKGNVAADGLYSFSEYKILKEKFGDQMIVVAVFAPPTLRYERISKRTSDISDLALRNRSFTRTEAKMRDFSEIENIEKGGPIAMADFTVLNTKDLNFLNEQLLTLIKEIEVNH